LNSDDVCSDLADSGQPYTVHSVSQAYRHSRQLGIQRNA